MCCFLMLGFFLIENRRPRLIGVPRGFLCCPMIAEERVVRVYCDGVFDLFHYGHARALETAKHAFPRVWLVVGVCADSDVSRSKGSNRPILSLSERVESLRHCRWVDEILPDAPWIPTPSFLIKHNIDYVAHDPAPYADALCNTDDVYQEVKRLGMFLPVSRTPNISTTDIVVRCLSTRDQ